MKDNLVLIPAQKALVFSQAKYRHVIGGIGSGMTTGIMYLVLLVAQMFNNNCILIGRRTFNLVRETSLVSFRELLATLNIPYEFRRAEMEIKLSNGTKILFRGITEHRISATGLELGMFVIEGLDEVPQHLFQILQSRLRKDNFELSDNANPDLARLFAEHWKRFSVTSSHGDTPQWMRDLWKDSTDPNYEAIYFKFGGNNKNLPPNYYEDIMGDMSDELKQKFFTGSWGGK